MIELGFLLLAREIDRINPKGMAEVSMLDNCLIRRPEHIPPSLGTVIFQLLGVSCAVLCRGLGSFPVKKPSLKRRYGSRRSLEVPMSQDHNGELDNQRGETPTGCSPSPMPTIVDKFLSPCHRLSFTQEYCSHYAFT
jgi:hypothetical protein